MLLSFSATDPSYKPDDIFFFIVLQTQFFLFLKLKTDIVMTHREQFTYLCTGREYYMKYFRVSELTIEDEQIRH